MTEINPKTPMKDLTIGGNIYCAGNAREFKTGDWRSMKPIWYEEKCKQCGLCFAVCPDNSIPVGKDCKRTETDFDYSVNWTHSSTNSDELDIHIFEYDD